MIQAVLFDLDGTLLDRDTSLIRFVHDQYERISQLQHVRQETFVQRFIELDQHGYVWKDKVYAQLIEELAIAKLEAAFCCKTTSVIFKSIVSRSRICMKCLPTCKSRASGWA